MRLRSIDTLREERIRFQLLIKLGLVAQLDVLAQLVAQNLMRRIYGAVHLGQVIEMMHTKLET
jgi:hypothetical protein